MAPLAIQVPKRPEKTIRELDGRCNEADRGRSGHMKSGQVAHLVSACITLRVAFLGSSSSEAWQR
jgi:hypothetical protein